MLLHVDMIANTTGSGNDTLVPLCLYQVEDDDEPFDQRVQQLAAQMPWAHNCMLLDKISDPETRYWYIQQTLRPGVVMAYNQNLITPTDNVKKVAQVAWKETCGRFTY